MSQIIVESTTVKVYSKYIKKYRGRFYKETRRPASQRISHCAVIPFSRQVCMHVNKSCLLQFLGQRTKASPVLHDGGEGKNKK